MQRLVLASNNAGKLREFAAMLSPLGYEVIPQSALNISEADEPHHTFVENALVKARHASRAAGLPALADDSGICVPALDGAPGVYSARYAGDPKSDQRNNEKLITELARHADRRAYYYCALVLVKHADDPTPLIALGRWDGEVIDTPRGSGGFGYDPHFRVAGMNNTAAELSAEAKNKISHRGQALAQLLAQLKHQP